MRSFEDSEERYQCVGSSDAIRLVLVDKRNVAAEHQSMSSSVVATLHGTLEQCATPHQGGWQPFGGAVLLMAACRSKICKNMSLYHAREGYEGSLLWLAWKQGHNSSIFISFKAHLTCNCHRCHLEPSGLFFLPHGSMEAVASSCVPLLPSVPDSCLSFHRKVSSAWPPPCCFNCSS
jgi:hypothetical protein